MLDTLFTNCYYPDFDRSKMSYGSIGLKDGKIAWIGNNGEVNIECSNTINLDGQIVSPGFIDIHMHEEDFAGEGHKYVISKLMLKQGVTTCAGGQCGVQKQEVKYFKKTIEELGGAPVNYMLLAGYNEFRAKLGLGRLDSANAEEIEKIVKLLKHQLKEGAYGVSFGIEYDPGISLEEIVKVINMINKPNLFIAAHYRADGMDAISSILEMIRIQKETGCNFQISHLSSCSAMGNMKEALSIINNEIEMNPKLNYDTYPYNAFSTTMGTEVFLDGCFEKWGKDYGDILLTDEPYKNVRCTKEIFEKCRREYPDMLAVAFVMNEDEIEMAIANKHGMIASDGIINHGNGHPRAGGTFPRVLGKYVREKKALTMIDALMKMTKLPAERLNLKTKGEVVLGYDGDLTIFNPNTIEDGSTFEKLDILPKGISYVVINGKVAVHNGNIVNDRLGKFICTN